MRVECRPGTDERDACGEDGDDDRRDDGNAKDRDHAARQVLQHLALRAVVIDRMRRAAGDRRHVEVVRVGSV